jgi:Domain of unknown function (DUF4232)
MRASGRLGWRGVAVVAFAATAVLAVTVSRGAPAHVALTSARHPSRAHGASGAAQCATSRLRIWLGTDSGPGTRATAGQGRSAGASVSTLEFTNVSGTACGLSGYPEVAAYGAGGAQIGNAAGRDTSVAARRIVLAPGATVHAAVVASVSASSCRPVAATGLRVVPPGQSAARYIRQAMPACAVAGPRAPVFLHVRAVQPGSGGAAKDAGNAHGKPEEQGKAEEAGRFGFLPARGQWGT